MYIFKIVAVNFYHTDDINAMKRKRKKRKNENV